MKNLLVLSLTSLLLMGVDCEKERLSGLDNGMMTTEEGLELSPRELPWTVVSQTLEHPEVLDSAITQMNEWFSPLVVFECEIDDDYFDELSFGSEDDRHGIILVSEGYVGTPNWDEGLDFNDDGGIADLRWNEEGEILFVDVIINVDYAYDAAWVERVLFHEFGHSLGLCHDANSIDLGSCMTSPPPHNCQIISADVERVSNRLDD